MPEFIVQPTISVDATTGLKAQRFVTVSTATGKLVYPANGADIVGVTFADSSTGSTKDVRIGVQAYGVANVEAAGSTQSAGARIAASSVGRAILWTTGKIQVGRLLYGSSGSTGRVVGVLLHHVGHSTALT
jgi:hypothetical protein